MEKKSKNYKLKHSSNFLCFQMCFVLPVLITLRCLIADQYFGTLENEKVWTVWSALRKSRKEYPGYVTSMDIGTQVYKGVKAWDKVCCWTQNEILKVFIKRSRSFYIFWTISIDEVRKLFETFSQTRLIVTKMFYWDERIVKENGKNRQKTPTSKFSFVSLQYLYYQYNN